MSTIEKLIVQIFERKKSVIEQVKHQIDLYDQQLASRLIIDGIAPPSWLWNTGSHSQSSDPTELKKEELISELLLPRPQSSIRYSTGHHALYNKPVVTLYKEDLPVDPFTEPRASIKGLDGPTLVPQCDHNNNVGCFLNSVSELEPQTTSPRDRTYVPDDPFPEPHASIKGLDEPTFVPQCDHNNKVGCFLNGVPELEPQTISPRDRTYVPDDPFPESRASIKGFDRPIVVPQCDHINIGSVLCSVSDLEPQTTSPPDRTDARSVDISPKPDKSLAKFQRSKSRQKALEIRNSATTGARSRLRYRKDNIVSSGGSSGFMIASLQSYHVNEAELVKPLDMTSESNGIRQEKVENSQSKERGSNIDSGRITRLNTEINSFGTQSKVSKPKQNSLRIWHITLPERESRHNNIVTSITSFVPLVQQKQAAAVITGKRDIKVKALEAAEAAKRLEKEKENERKMKKEATKLERARLEQENLRQLELKKKKKEEAQKKKDADIVVRKRAREEEEKKEKEGKRKCIEEARRQQREQEEKLHAGKQENSMALVASSQQQIDVNLIFSPDSFCSIDEVLMPRQK